MLAWIDHHAKSRHQHDWSCAAHSAVKHPSTSSNSRSKVCVKYAGPMELWNDALVTTCEGQSRRRFSPLRLSANTEMLRTACFLCVIGHRELLACLRHPSCMVGSHEQ